MIAKLFAAGCVASGLFLSVHVDNAAASARIPVETARLTTTNALFDCVEHDLFWACHTWNGDLFLILK